MVCLLEGIFTVEERLLISKKRFATVRDSRMAVQDEMRSASVAKVEELTGRTVLASFSQVNCDPEPALEMFVVAPVCARTVNRSAGRRFVRMGATTTLRETGVVLK